MLKFPNSKINIGLNVISKRPDNFHEIESVMYPVPFTDVLEAVQYPVMRFQTAGLKIKGKNSENLCYRAWELMNREHGIGNVDMFLYKHIPMGSGLGGGSSDAAFTLKLLNELYETGLSQAELKDYAAQLGSDCPFFIDNLPAIVKGRGEIIEKIEISLKGCFVKLIIPPVHISTAHAYKNILAAKAEHPIEKICTVPIKEWKEFVQNDFEKIVISKYPDLNNIKIKLYESGALFASMSGSGSAFYGIYDQKPDSELFKGMLERVCEL